MEQKNSQNIFELWENRIAPIVRRAIKFWYVALAVAAAAFGLSYFSERKKLPEFSAKITCMLEDDILGESGGGGTGNQLLLALSGQKTQSNKAVLVDLGLSNKLIEETLLKTVRKDSADVLLANYFIDNFGYRKDWHNSNLKNFKYPENYQIGTSKESDYWLRQFSNIVKISLKSQVMESGLIVVTFSSSDEWFTKSFLESHLATISEFYIEKKTERSLNLMRFAKRKKDSLQAALTGKTYGLANMQDQGFGAVMRRAKVPELQVTRDIGIITQQYNESMLALSSASIDLERQRPFITIVDDIRLPLDSKWPKPLNKAMIMGFLALILTFAAIAGVFVGIDYLNEQKKQFELSS